MGFVVIFLTTVLACLLFGATSALEPPHRNALSTVLVARLGVFLILIVGVQTPVLSPRPGSSS